MITRWQLAGALGILIAGPFGASRAGLLGPGTPTDTAVESLTVTVDETGAGLRYTVTRAGVTTSGTIPMVLLGGRIPSYDFTGTPAVSPDHPLQFGDVYFLEPGALPGQPASDAFLFHPNAPNLLCFFSDDHEPPPPEPSPFKDIDVFPPTSNHVVINEDAAGERADYFSNSAFFQDSIPNPNFDPNFAHVEFHMISDTPEPASLALFTSGVAFVVLRTRARVRRKRTWATGLRQ